MKILATSCPNQGHLFPMLPTLWALRNAGHEVLVAVPDRFVPLATAAGLPAISIAADFNLGDLGLRKANQGPTVSDLADHLVDYYVPATKLTVRSTVALAEAWRPDLVMCTDWEYAGPIAAAVTAVPTVLHGRGLLAHPGVDGPVAEALRPIHREWGLRDGAPAHWRTIDNCPPGLQWTTPPDTAIPSRYVAYNGSGVLPSWLLTPPEAPRVLVTLGNVPIKGNHADVLQRVVKALAPFDIDVVIAAGDNLDVGQLGTLSRRTRLVKGLPLSHVMPTCTAVIHHGGAGSAMSATIAGVPQLGLPQMCVQYQHADRVAEVGAGLVLHPEAATVEAIGGAVYSLLEDLRPRGTVRRLAAENAGRPRLDQVVQELEGAAAALPTSVVGTRPAWSRHTSRSPAPSIAEPEPRTREMTVTPIETVHWAIATEPTSAGERRSPVLTPGATDDEPLADDFDREDESTVA
jgi:UDP:flavonoid glycosyltransferase YjiC (YdhE family)